MDARSAAPPARLPAPTQDASTENPPRAQPTAPNQPWHQTSPREPAAATSLSASSSLKKESKCRIQGCERTHAAVA